MVSQYLGSLRAAADVKAAQSRVDLAKALLDHNPHPNEAEIRYALAGNLCRCTGYDKIVHAVLEVSKAGASKAA